MTSSKRWLKTTQTESHRLKADLGGCPMTMELRTDWEVRRSGLDADLLYFCMEGGFVIHGRRGVRTCSAGDVVVVPAGLTFHFSLGSQRRARIARFRLKRPSGSRSPAGGVMIFSAGRTTGVWLSVLKSELAADAGDLHKARSSLALRGVLDSLELPSRKTTARAGRWRTLSALEMDRIRHWAEELGPKSRPGLNDLSGILGMSPDYSARLFRQAFGQSFEKWIIAARMQSAALRISESKLTIAAISEEFGFSTPFFFSRQFKDVMGCSPRCFRAEQV